MPEPWLLAKDLAAHLGVRKGMFYIEFNVPWDETIHDCPITADSGWKILLGRGLDISQKGSSSQFDMCARRQESRRLVAIGVTDINEGKGAR